MSVRGFALFETPIGACGVAWSEAGLLATRLPEPPIRRARASWRGAFAGLRGGADAAGRSPAIAERIAAHLGGGADRLCRCRARLTAASARGSAASIAPPRRSRSARPGPMARWPRRSAGRRRRRRWGRRSAAIPGRSSFPATASSPPTAGPAASPRPAAPTTKLRLLEIEGALAPASLPLFAPLDGLDGAPPRSAAAAAGRSGAAPPVRATMPRSPPRPAPARPRCSPRGCCACCSPAPIPRRSSASPSPRPARRRWRSASMAAWRAGCGRRTSISPTDLIALGERVDPATRERRAHPVRVGAGGDRRRAAHPDHPRLRAEPARRLPGRGGADARLPAAGGARGAAARPRHAGRDAGPRRAGGRSRPRPRRSGAQPADGRGRRGGLPARLRPRARRARRAGRRAKASSRACACCSICRSAISRRRSPPNAPTMPSISRTLRAVADANRAWGAATGLSACDAIAAWLARGGTERGQTIGELAKVVLTGKGEPRKASAGLLRAAPDYEAAAARLADCCRRLIRMRVLAAMVAALAAGPARRPGLRRPPIATPSAPQGVADFDDLIRWAERLLAEPGMGEWVRYKLDQRTDHILVDEAQDTNARQWRIVKALVDEYFAGAERARPAPDDLHRRRFQAGDLRLPGHRPARVRGRARAISASWPLAARDAALDLGRCRRSALPPDFHDLSMETSFRSSPEILAVTDRVIGDLGHEAFGLPERPLPHAAHHSGRAGSVTLWKPFVAEADEGEEGWIAETTRAYAGALAKQIKAWLDAPFRIEKTGKPLRPEDILILVRRRGELAGLLVARLHREGVPVAGVDRLRLVGAAGGAGSARRRPLRGPAARRSQPRQPARLAAVRLVAGRALRGRRGPQGRALAGGAGRRRRRRRGTGLAACSRWPISRRRTASSRRSCPARSTAAASCSTGWARRRAIRSRNCSPPRSVSPARRPRCRISSTGSRAARSRSSAILPRRATRCG